MPLFATNMVVCWAKKSGGELLSMGLRDSSQPIKVVLVGVMMGIRCLEAHVKAGN